MGIWPVKDGQRADCYKSVWVLFYYEISLLSLRVDLRIMVTKLGLYIPQSTCGGASPPVASHCLNQENLF